MGHGPNPTRTPTPFAKFFGKRITMGLALEANIGRRKLERHRASLSGSGGQMAGHSRGHKLPQRHLQVALLGTPPTQHWAKGCSFVCAPGVESGLVEISGNDTPRSSLEPRTSMEHRPSLEPRVLRVERTSLEPWPSLEPRRSMEPRPFWVLLRSGTRRAVLLLRIISRWDDPQSGNR